MIGRVFANRYRITECIGVGGMAEVYKALDTVLGRTVAVKIMLPQYAADPEFTARFRQEAASAANLQNPYIVNVYDWGQDGGTYFIVMEYVRGTDLKSAIQQRGAINQRKVAEIGSQVCQALTAAHGQDIVHRDIKPQNIMVQPDGNVKVMDFGIVCAKNSVKAQTGNVLGTAHYISPEQAQGKELGGTSDIYSLGCVLYEAATGTLPFDGADAVSVAMQQVNDAPVPPSHINPTIDPDFEDIIMKAMEKIPANRFATARDMKKCLDDFLMGRPVNLNAAVMGANQTAVLGAGAVGAGAGGVTTNMGAAGGTAVMPMMNAGSGMGATTTRPTGYHGNTDNNINIPNRNTKRTVGIVIGVLLALALIGGGAFALFSGMISFGGEKGVPDLSGKTLEAAETLLTDKGYTLGDASEEYSADVVAGRIISQDPVAGTEAEKGTAVNVVVSKGPEKIEVPDLKSLTPEQAEQSLSEKGLKGRSGDASYSDTEKGLVFKQDQEPGSTLDKGSTVTYYISLGKEMISVQNVVGSDIETAVRTLEDAGFKVVAESGGYDNSEKYAKNIVMSQTPNGGQLAKGETITLTYSEGVDPETLPVEIPDVQGWGVDDAKAAIENAGFLCGISYSYDENVEKDVVIRQDRTGSAKKGTEIAITVSKGPADQ